MATPQRSIALPIGRVNVFEGCVETLYPRADGSVARSSFIPPVEDAEFRRCAGLFGYGTTKAAAMRYGIEHDLTHHFVALVLGAPQSRVVWAEAHRQWKKTFAEDKSRPWPWRCPDEEHLTNRLQLFTWHGVEDDDHGCLRGAWGDLLPVVSWWHRWFLRPEMWDMPEVPLPKPRPSVPEYPDPAPEMMRSITGPCPWAELNLLERNRP